MNSFLTAEDAEKRREKIEKVVEHADLFDCHFFREFC